jgi:carboxymethylenebutenolidase
MGMGLKTEWIRFGRDGQHTGFAARLDNASAPLPGLVVIQEAWGVDGHIEDVVVRFAKAGYVVLAPDLWSEGGERPAYFSRPRMDALKEFANTLPPAAWGDPKVREEALAKVSDPRRFELGESFGALMTSALGKIDSYVPKVFDAAEYLRSEHPLSRGGRVGAVGYCMGGGLAARLACADPKLGAAVIYYGNAPAAEQIARIACPVLGLYGSLDARINAGIADFVTAMREHGKRLEHHVYEGAGHAFFNDTRPAYNASASRDAFARTLEFFRRELYEGRSWGRAVGSRQVFREGGVQRFQVERLVEK